MNFIFQINETEVLQIPEFYCFRVNDNCSPYVVPQKFSAFTLKECAVPDLNPVTTALTFVRVFPVTGLCVAVTVFQTNLQPALGWHTKTVYSKVTKVDEPLAFTIPFNVAPVEEIFVAADVEAIGTSSHGGGVVKVIVSP